MAFGSSYVPAPTFKSGLTIFGEGGATYWMPDGEDVELIKPLITSRSTRSPAAPAPAPTGGHARLLATPAAGERVVNNQRDPHLTNNDAIGNNVRARSVSDAIARGGAPPVMLRAGAQVPTCVSWHGKGTCYDNCRRSTDHIQHTNAEREQFFTWCQAAFA